jgi:hypothetical protein
MAGMDVNPQRIMLQPEDRNRITATAAISEGKPVAVLIRLETEDGALRARITIEAVRKLAKDLAGICVFADC